jgi:hypothetical protein
MNSFSPIALQRLRDAGWTEDRSIDLTEYEREVRQLGFELLPPVRTFLARFGNLHLMGEPTLLQRTLGTTTAFRKWLAPTHYWLSTMLLKPERWRFVADQEVGEDLGVTLQYIGVWGPDTTDQADLLMSPEGFVYQSNIYTFRIGLSGKDFLNRTLSQGPGFLPAV